MGKIQVNNIKLYANHGCLEEEAKIGSWYRVDIEVEVDLTKSSISDALEDTVDYVHLNKIVKEEKKMAYDEAAILMPTLQNEQTPVENIDIFTDKDIVQSCSGKVKKSQ